MQYYCPQSPPWRSSYSVIEELQRQGSGWRQTDSQPAGGAGFLQPAQPAASQPGRAGRAFPRAALWAQQVPGPTPSQEATPLGDRRLCGRRALSHLAVRGCQGQVPSTSTSTSACACAEYRRTGDRLASVVRPGVFLLFLLAVSVARLVSFISAAQCSASEHGVGIASAGYCICWVCVCVCMYARSVYLIGTHIHALSARQTLHTSCRPHHTVHTHTNTHTHTHTHTRYVHTPYMYTHPHPRRLFATHHIASRRLLARPQATPRRADAEMGGHRHRKTRSQAQPSPAKPSPASPGSSPAQAGALAKRQLRSHARGSRGWAAGWGSRRRAAICPSRRASSNAPVLAFPSGRPATRS